MEKGFTLIELLVVCIMVGILVAVSVPQYQMAVQRVRYGQLQTMVKQLFKAEQIYYLENAEFTVDFDQLDISSLPPRPKELVAPHGEVIAYPPPPYPYGLDTNFANAWVTPNGSILVSKGESYVSIIGLWEDLLPANYQLFWFPAENVLETRCSFADEDRQAGRKLCQTVGARRNLNYEDETSFYGGGYCLW